MIDLTKRRRRMSSSTDAPTLSYPRRES
jgi:hypothetical protein